MSDNKPERLEWEAVIPLFTNPFMWADLAKALSVPLVLFGGLIVIILADDSNPDWGGAAGLLAICAAVVLGLFVITELVVFRNRFAARFSLDHAGVSYESGRTARAVRKAGLIVGLLAGSPLLTGGSLLASSMASLRIGWKDVKKVTPFPKRKVITLSNSWRPVLRLYCPDRETYEAALQLIAEGAGLNF
jgi:hypothetical protein